MNIRKKLAAFSLVAATLTAGLGSTVLAGSASAHHQYGHLTTSRTEQVGSEQYMKTTSDLYKTSNVLVSKTDVWTTGWWGFHGCVYVDMFDGYGRYISSTGTQRIGTTGILGSVRTVAWDTYLPTYVVQSVQRLQAVQFKC